MPPSPLALSLPAEMDSVIRLYLEEQFSYLYVFHTSGTWSVKSNQGFVSLVVK